MLKAVALLLIFTGVCFGVVSSGILSYALLAIVLIIGGILILLKTD